MSHAQPHRAAFRANRRLAAALVLIGLFMQMLAPYLPMPAMGGLTSWDLAWLPICTSPESGRGGDGDSQHHLRDCAACLVMQQAGTTLAPDVPTLRMPALAQAIAPALRPQALRAAPATGGFSSRAPPLLG